MAQAISHPEVPGGRHGGGQGMQWESTTWGRLPRKAMVGVLGKSPREVEGILNRLGCGGGRFHEGMVVPACCLGGVGVHGAVLPTAPACRMSAACLSLSDRLSPATPMFDSCFHTGISREGHGMFIMDTRIGTHAH